MIRLRLATLVLISVLSACCGCMSLFDHPWFGRHCECAEDGCYGCCEAGAPCAADGPVLGDYPAPVAPGCGPIGPPGIPPLTAPPSAPPRLVPQPQSQPLPYGPGR